MPAKTHSIVRTNTPELVNLYARQDIGDPKLKAMLAPVVMQLAGHTMEVSELIKALMAVLKQFKKQHPRRKSFGWISRSIQYQKAVVALLSVMVGVLITAIVMVAVPMYGFVILNYFSLLIADLVLVWWGVTFVRQLDETDVTKLAVWKRAIPATLFFLAVTMGEFIDLHYIEQDNLLNIVISVLLAASALTVVITSWRAQYNELIVKPREREELMVNAVRSVFLACKRLTSIGGSVATEDLNREAMNALFVAILDADLIPQKTQFALFGQLAPAELLHDLA